MEGGGIFFRRLDDEEFPTLTMLVERGRFELKKKFFKRLRGALSREVFSLLKKRRRRGLPLHPPPFPQARA
jgi:hypothetical protein